MVKRREARQMRKREAWQQEQGQRQQQAGTLQHCTNCGVGVVVGYSTCADCGAPLCISCSRGSTVCARCKKGE